MHPIQIAKWRKAALEQLPELFVDGRRRLGRNGEADGHELYEEIGRLRVELDWLKKSLPARLSSCGRWWSGANLPSKGALPPTPEISMRRQCELLGVNRSGLYYQPVGESEENLRLMRLLDEHPERVLSDS